jgi:hypothetical protein
MSEPEVQEILGRRGIQLKFNSEEELKNLAECLMMQAPPGATMKRWDHKHSSTHVLFDSDNRVAGVYYPRGAGRYVNIMLRSVGLD